MILTNSQRVAFEKMEGALFNKVFALYRCSDEFEQITFAIRLGWDNDGRITLRNEAWTNKDVAANMLNSAYRYGYTVVVDKSLDDMNVASTIQNAIDRFKEIYFT